MMSLPSGQYFCKMSIQMLDAGSFLMMRLIRGLVFFTGFAGLFFSEAASAEEISFNRDIRPILSENCFHCHGPAEEGRKAELRLDEPASAYADRDGVRVIVPGDLKESELVYRIRSSDPDEIMPPADSHYKLSENQKGLLERWIKGGAQYQGHWAYAAPVSKENGAIRDMIDHRIGTRLKQEGLKLSPSAGSEALIRRLSLDLRGLPPTNAEVQQFLADQSPGAWEALVDRMLASSHCAERLALDWLDTARYADTNGYSIDDHRDMWGWRDWVIQAFIENKPYSEFIIEQLAGDLLPGATPEQKMATGFLRNGMNTHEGGTIPEEYRVAYIVDKVDTVATSFMGMTMKCAQCHDHKYDPISQEDYFRFYAFFDSATVRGHGATNGNTAPFIKVASPLSEQTAFLDELKVRLERIKHLRENLGEANPVEFASWSEEVLAKSPLPENQEKSKSEPSKAGFQMPGSDRQPEWIWSEKSGATPRILIRKKIKVEGELNGAYVFYTCDNNASLYVNGRKMGHVDPWMKPQLVDITSALRQGENIIAADAANAGGVAGFIAWVQLSYKDGNTRHELTDLSWSWRKPSPGKIAEMLAGEEGWQSPVSLGRHGVGPWRKLPMPGAAPAADGTTLAGILRKAKAERSSEEKRQLNETFKKQSSLLTRRMDKALSIEQGIVEKQIKEQGQTSVMVMDNPGKRKTRILMRGEYNNPGKEVTPGVPGLFASLPSDAPGSRLSLAKWLIDDEHPLTARVVVNRYWQMIFGTGIVSTSEDFGSQGEWPSHPQLLDAMAVAFRRDGWNLKGLLKEIVMSKTYRQRSEISGGNLELDPYNRLLSRAPRYRLQAELIRDNALAISGILDNKVGGPSVYPSQPDGLWRQVSHFGYGAFTAQAYFGDIGQRAHRRSMYTFWKRTAPPPGMAIFDAPTRETCTVRRLNTNTPLQALVLLNDPQYIEASRALAGRMLKEGGATSRERISYAFRLATARTISKAELNILHGAFVREKKRFTKDPAAALGLLSVNQQAPGTIDLAAYAMVASTILNLNETITRQ